MPFTIHSTLLELNALHTKIQTLFQELVFFFLLRLPPRSTLFPYTTLFRSMGLQDRSTPVTLFGPRGAQRILGDRKSTRLNSSHVEISYAVFCLKKKNRSRTSEAASWSSPYICP